MTRALAHAIVVALAVATVMPAGVAHARGSKADQAAEHFALAEAAEKRQDWEAAILEYKQAYALEPHPSVLYNIALNYERLEEWSDAAEYYRRYLEEDADAPDRAKVQVKIDALQAKAAKARPRPTSGSGRLVVYANVDAADVKIDGVRVGVTPFEGDVPAGEHELELVKARHKPKKRRIYVQAGGTEMIREKLESDGTSGEDPDPNATGGRRSQIHLGIGSGLDLAKQEYRLAFMFGMRINWLELNFLIGHFSRNDSGVGVDTRIYLGGTKFRPYARAGFTYGNATIGSSEERKTFGFEGGGGLMYSIFMLPQGTAGTAGTTRRMTSFDYFLEANARATLGGYELGETVGTGMVQESEAVARFIVSIDLGIVIRW